MHVKLNPRLREVDAVEVDGQTYRHGETFNVDDTVAETHRTPSRGEDHKTFVRTTDDTADDTPPEETATPVTATSTRKKGA